MPLRTPNTMLYLQLIIFYNMAQPVIVQPGTQTTVVIGQQVSSQVARDWASDLFGCFGDIEICECDKACMSIFE